MSDSEHPEIPAGTRVGDFVIMSLIGDGGYGEIYHVKEESTQQHLAMKIEYLDAKKRGMSTEIKILKGLQGSEYFPKLITNGRTEEFRFFVMDLFGPSVSQARRALKAHYYSRQTYLRVAYHSLNCIKEMHARGYIHRDIKPANFLIKPDRNNPIILIDFGLSRSYISHKTGQHRPPRSDPGYTGTVRYASLHAHDEEELSRRDDLISWFYSLTELATGSTPWPGSQDRKKTIEMKRTMTTKDLCTPFPKEFERIWEYLCSLEYAEEPDYAMIQSLIIQALRKERPRESRYDWEYLSKADMQEITPINMDMGEVSLEEVESPPSQVEEENTLLEESCCCAVQ